MSTTEPSSRPPANPSPEEVALIESAVASSLQGSSSDLAARGFSASEIGTSILLVSLICADIDRRCGSMSVATGLDSQRLRECVMRALASALTVGVDAVNQLRKGN